jgi:hypothetical protein
MALHGVRAMKGSRRVASMVGVHSVEVSGADTPRY